MTPTIQCKWEGCIYRHTDSYSLSKHESRCRFRQRFPHNSSRNLSSPYTQPLNHADSQQNNDVSGETTTDIPVAPTYPMEDTGDDDESPQFQDSAYLIKSLAVSFCGFQQHIQIDAINEVIDIIRNPSFSLSDFRDSIRSYDDCKAIADVLLKQHLQHNKFLSVQTMDNSGTSYGLMYFKDPIKLLQSQLKLADNENCLFRPSQMVLNGQRAVSHPLHSMHAHQLYQHVRNTIITSEQEHIFWNDEVSRGLLSF